MDQTEQQWIEAIKSRFLPEKAAGISLTLQVELLGETSPDWYVMVKDKTIDIQPGKAPQANATLKASRTDLLDVFSGKINPTQALMTGKIKVSGDLMAASRLVNVFQR